jgi:hypothetical protein
MNRPAPFRQADVDRAPMRLLDAARAVMGDSAPSAAWLRKQAAEGRLVIWRIAGKDYTTEQAVREMLDQCALKGQGSGFGQLTTKPPQCGSSATEPGKSALDALRQNAKKLRESLANTSQQSTSPPASGGVTLFPSRSRT